MHVTMYSHGAQLPLAADIRERLAAQGWTIERLAHAVGTPPSYLASLIRCGRVTPAMADRLARALGVDSIVER